LRAFSNGLLFPSDHFAEVNLEEVKVSDPVFVLSFVLIAKLEYNGKSVFIGQGEIETRFYIFEFFFSLFYFLILEFHLETVCDV
jgi:hypothetical protein